MQIMQHLMEPFHYHGPPSVSKLVWKRTLQLSLFKRNGILIYGLPAFMVKFLWLQLHFTLQLSIKTQIYKERTYKVPHILDLSTKWATHRNSSQHSTDRRKYKHCYKEINLLLPGIKAQPFRSHPAGSYIGSHRQLTSFPHLMFNWSFNMKSNLPRAERDSFQVLTKFGQW